jgi:hypothetical protein
VIAVAVALVLSLYVSILMQVGRVSELSTPRLRPSAIVWHGRVYTNRHDLVAAFKARGVPYAPWAKQHPAAVAIVTHQPPPVIVPVAHTRAVHTHSKPTAATTTVASRRAPPAHAVAATGGGHWYRGIGADVLWVLALVLFSVAAGPARLIARAGIGPLRREQRIVLAAATGSIMFGLLVASSTA